MFPKLPLLVLATFLDPASAAGDATRQLFIQFLWAAGAVLLLVTGLVVYYSIRYRARPGDDKEPVQKHTHLGLEIIILSVTTAVMGVYLFLTIRTMLFIQPKAEAALQPDLIITGHQWWWEARYPGSGVVTANEIHIPAGKRLYVQVESADVIHDWWVPELSRKMDLIPGRSNFVWLEARTPGRYLGACSEFCGAQHAWMRIQVIAHTPKQFEHWQQSQLRPIAQVPSELSRQGEALFYRSTCAHCHSIDGTQANGTIGPNLTHLSSRKTLLTGVLDNTPENLAQWIAHPDRIKPGSHMPRFILSDREVKALVAYLESLK